MSFGKRHLFAAVLCLAAALAPSAWAQEAGFDGGSGTAGDPYRISSAQQLFYLGERVNAGDPELSRAHYLLTADINLEEELFPPIGISPETPFRGTFDGGGQIIYNLLVDNKLLLEDESYDHLTQQGTVVPKNGGMFGCLEGGTVKNLTVTGHVSAESSGGLVCRSHNGTIVNCVSAVSPWAGYYAHGFWRIGSGIVSGDSGGTVVRNCCFAGGLVNNIILNIPQSEIPIVIDNCFTLGSRDTTVMGLPGEPIYMKDSQTTVSMDPVPQDATTTQGEADAQAAVLWPAWLNALADDLNAWVDAQPEGEYDHWMPVPGYFPVMGDHLIYFEAETGEYLPLGETEGFTPLEAVRGGAVVELYDRAISGLPTLRPSFLPVLDGVSRTVFFEVYEGYRICDVVVDGVSVGPVESYTFPAVTEDHTILVRFVEESSMEHFAPSLPYRGYEDVDEGAWYGTEHEGTVSMATRLGLFAGVGEGRFAPDAPLTLGEAVKLAAVMRDTYRNEGYPFDQGAGAHWYDTYVDYAVSAGILEGGEFEDFARPASRAEMAYLFARALPSREYGTISSLRPSDVTSEDLYYSEIMQLYDAGILKGSDDEGTFRGEDTVTRVEAAAIAVRVAVPDLRSTAAG